MAKSLHVLAQAQQSGFRPGVIGDIRPFRATNCTEENRIRSLRARHRGIRDRGTMRVIRRTADKVGLGLEFGDAGVIEEGRDLLHLGCDFRADAVPRQEQKIEGRHAKDPLCGAGHPRCAGLLDRRKLRVDYKLQFEPATCFSSSKAKSWETRMR